MNGYLLINKPKGPTSHDMIYKIRRIAKTKKVGHTGTLDPMATGLMVVCIGRATKAADYITNGDKAYIATMELGMISDTLDNTGTVTSLPKKQIPESKLKDAIFSFVGEYLQTPPMYSAKKIDGTRLYELARQGAEIKRKPVPVTIHEIKILSIEGQIVTFYVKCSKGTYIRSLIDDIGKKLNYGAVMTGLQRVESGRFSLENNHCYTLEELEQAEDISSFLHTLDTAFLSYPKLNVSPQMERLIKNGIVVDLKRLHISPETPNGTLFRVYDENNTFFAVMEVWEKSFLKLKTTFFSNGESEL